MASHKKAGIRPFLKWAGGKYDLVEKIIKYLPDRKILIEPFLGAGSIFLNTDYEKYILNDINEDLINLYRTIQEDSGNFIRDAKRFFQKRNQTEKAYYRLRNRFNHSDEIYERSLLFLYLNRHGYNGLCRYNQLGEFNVPYGQYKKPVFPEQNISIFAEKAQKATFTCGDFKTIFGRARKNHVIYCDPPYVPLSDTANFSGYATEGFTLHDHERLAETARIVSKRGTPVIISNHNTRFVRKLYKGAKLVSINARRNISCKPSGRIKESEVIAIFQG